MSDDPSPFARMLRECRARAGLRQVDLAARSGIGQSVISRAETGSRAPLFTTGWRLLRAVGASPEEIARAAGEEL